MAVWDGKKEPESFCFRRSLTSRSDRGREQGVEVLRIYDRPWSGLDSGDAAASSKMMGANLNHGVAEL